MKQTRKQTIKDAHAAIIAAEKLGINTDHLREMLVDGSNWDGIQRLTNDLKANVEVEAVRAQVKADITQDMNQALNQTANDIMGSLSILGTDTASRTAS